MQGKTTKSTDFYALTVGQGMTDMFDHFLDAQLDIVVRQMVLAPRHLINEF